MDINFVSKIYNNRNSYADVLTNEQLEELHVSTNIEKLIADFIEKKKFILLTGNPGDGKTHLIKAIDEVLRRNNAFIEYDINEVEEYAVFIQKLNEALDQGRPCIIAINEYPLIQLLNELNEKVPYYNSIATIRENPLIYNNNVKAIDTNKVVIVDLNNRNLLSKDVFKRSLERLINISRQCNTCKDNNQCEAYTNIQALSNEVVVSRLITLVEMIGKSGLHVVMRDIFGFISYILTQGKGCDDLSENERDQYFNLIFTGKNALFEAIKQFDPYNYSYPEIDEMLWNGNLTEGWILDTPTLVPQLCKTEEEAIDTFIYLKRKFYFENERGHELLALIPMEFNEFFNILKNSYDHEIDVIKRIILAINRFFNHDDNEPEKLRIWITHNYELRTSPPVTVTNKSYSFDMMTVLVPNVPKYLDIGQYVPDHFLLRIKSPSITDKFVDLKVDLNLYKIITLISEGYPSQLVPEEYKFKLYRFMNQLASLEDRSRSNTFLARDIKSNNSFSFSIRDNKYMEK